MDRPLGRSAIHKVVCLDLSHRCHPDRCTERHLRGKRAQYSRVNCVANIFQPSRYPSTGFHRRRRKNGIAIQYWDICWKHVQGHSSPASVVVKQALPTHPGTREAAPLPLWREATRETKLVRFARHTRQCDPLTLKTQYHHYPAFKRRDEAPPFCTPSSLPPVRFPSRTPSLLPRRRVSCTTCERRIMRPLHLHLFKL